MQEGSLIGGDNLVLWVIPKHVDNVPEIGGKKACLPGP